MKSSILTAITVVIAIGLGVVVFMQQTELSSLKNQISAQSSPMVDASLDGKKTSEGSVVSEKKINAAGKNIVFQYRCSGEIKKGLDTIGNPAEIFSYCVGDYALVALEGDQSIDITSGHAKDGYDAPVLQKIEVLNDQKNILISFKPSCASTLDCGAGMPTNYVTHLYRINELSSRSISNYPPFGSPVWNALETKALFIPDTCGGAGCSMAPIIGYDLEHDSSIDLTQERAAGLSEGMKSSDITDAMGDRLPVWKTVQWNVGDAFTAVMIKEDGKTENVKGTF
jgi:hypothetical protein